MLRSEWAKKFLAQCGFPYSPESVIAVVAWCESERAHTLPANGARWNPFDTTEPWAGATDFNSVHVRNYQSAADGLAATKATLFNGYYSAVVTAFALQETAEQICDALTRSPWGSHPDAGLVRTVRASLDTFDVAITGDEDPTQPPQPPLPVLVAPPFPLPAGHWFGVPSSDSHNHSGFYSEADAHAFMPWQQRMADRGWNIKADGQFGPATLQVCVAFQREKALTPDGLVGPITWDAAWALAVTA